MVWIIPIVILVLSSYFTNSWGYLIAVAANGTATTNNGTSTADTKITDAATGTKKNEPSNSPEAGNAR